MKRIFLAVLVLLLMGLPLASCSPAKVTRTVVIERTYVPSAPHPIPGGYNERVWVKVVTSIYGHLRAGEIEYADEYLAASEKYNGIEFARVTRQAAEKMMVTRQISTEER